MKQLFQRLFKLAQVVLALAILAIAAGLPSLWVGYASLFVLDFAAIAWVGDKSSGGGQRRRLEVPLGALCVVGA